MLNKYIIIGLLVLSLVGICTYYYNDTQNRISELIEQNVNQEAVIKQYKEVNTSNKKIIKVFSDYTVKQQANVQELNIKLKETDEKNAEFRNNLRKHNLSLIIEKKPQLIEKGINNVSKKVLQDITNITDY